MNIRSSWFLKGTLVLGGVVFLWWAQRGLDLIGLLHPERVESWLASFGSLAPLAFVLTMAAAVVVSPIPSLPLDVAAGALFGPALGTFYAVVGALAGAVVSFGIARLLGRELIERFLGGHINFCQACSDHLLTKVVFVSRLLPVISFDVISYGAGLTQMSLKSFSLATGLGMLPLTFVYVYFGSALVPAGGVGVGVALAIVGLFFLIPRWIERYNFLSLRRFFGHEES